MAGNANSLMEKLVSLCKRRGYIFPGSEIYGGINGCWDYGPLGVELKRNVKDAWWNDVVRAREDMVGLDCAILMNRRVWEASGHAGGFTDPMIDCRGCKARYRADKIFAVTVSAGEQTMTTGAEADTAEEALAAAESKIAKFGKKHKDAGEPQVLSGEIIAEDDDPRFACPNCGEAKLTRPRAFNLMFETYVGALQDAGSKTYLRPETAQGIFCNFANVVDTTRIKLPFGIAQIGKSFRNEINPRNFTFRSREFEQMEIEFFVPPDQADEWYTRWRDERFQWYVDLGLKSERLQLREHDPDELAHYAKACADVEYEFPFGVSELEGIANRTDFDLRQHSEHSGKDLSYFDDETKQRYIPYVIEPSAGADRATLAFLCEAYCEEEVKGENRTVMRLHPRLAPVKAAFFPLVKKEGMPEKTREIYDVVRKRYACFYDEKGAVGRRYRRQDEAGTPYCFTIDGQTMEDGTVTVRERDSMEQSRINGDQVGAFLHDKLGI